ncbi:MAG: aldo/keto reductase [Bacteroidia bacterium]|nr:aldo/keto reductase [Bacteroidia bacterium]
MKYKLLGKSGLRVSEICLGTMTFGTAWGWGADRMTSHSIYSAFLDAGGNFIDTANRYTEGESESFLGEFMQEHRNKIVMATKYSLHSAEKHLNDGGNHRKNLVQSLEKSLARLRTDYVDVLYLHAWDFMTPEEEVMRALDDLVRAGKVLYIAISDTPAWMVSRSNTLAELRGWTQFIGLQIEYSLLQRTPERDLIPMAAHMDIGVTAWAPLAGGALSGKYLNEEKAGRLSAESKRLNENSQRITREVVAVAEEIGCTAAQVAMNWVRQKGKVIIPIVGARKVEQIQDSLGCLNYPLSEAQMKRLDEASAIEVGFPHDFLTSDTVKNVLFNGNFDLIENHRK